MKHSHVLVTALTRSMRFLCNFRQQATLIVAPVTIDH